MTVQRGQGDPRGRRIARRRNLQLAEAARAGRVFSALLRRADYPAPELSDLLAAVADEEAGQLMRSAGHIEPRKRFKSGSGQPLHEVRVPDYLFLDESGQPAPSSPDSFFAIGGVAMAEEDVATYRDRADALKMKFFGKTDITFHEPLMRRHRESFSFGGDQRQQEAFCKALDDLIDMSACTLFGVVIRKTELAEFVRSDSDPYLPTGAYTIAIHMLMERYVDYLATRDDAALGRITFESVGPREDAEHHREYLDLLLDGTQWVSDSAFRNWLRTGCEFTRKQGSDPMEIADMFARDLFEWARGGCGGSEPRRWEVWQPKIYAREDGQRGKFGIKVFPDSDIRDRIEEHRQEVILGRN